MTKRTGREGKGKRERDPIEEREGRRNKGGGRAERKTGKGAKTGIKNDITHLHGCFSRRQTPSPPPPHSLVSQECPPDTAQVRAQPSSS